MANQGPDGTASIAPEFVIGVTGHRDPEDTCQDGLRAALRAVLADIAGRFDHAPVTLTTGLAEGADTLATEVALEMGLRVRAVLPMPRAAYEADFTGAALERFRALADDPRVSVHEIPMAGGADRDAQYQALADYLVRRANLLVALWDGVVNDLPGGTADVALRYLADGGPERPVEVAHDPALAGSCGNVVIRIPTRRASAGGDGPATPQYLVSNTNHDCWSRHPGLPGPVLKRWAGFDAYMAERLSETGAELPAYGLAGDALTTPDAAALDGEFIRTDQLARAYQGRSDRMFALFGLLAAGMGLFFLVYAKLLAAKVFLILYVALFAAGFVGFRLSARRHLHGKHLAFRTLAETYRVQYFLLLSGAGQGYRLRRMLGLTSVDQFHGFEWLEEAIRCAEPSVHAGHCAQADAIAAVRRLWIEDQSAYFARRLHRLHAQHHRLETIKSGLLFGSVLGALALILFKKALLHLEMAGFDGKVWLVFLMGLLPLWAAIWELYQGKMATRELLWQYANQRWIFRAAEQEIAQTRGPDDAGRILRDLADRALMEIYLWSVHRYHREHEPPAAG